MNELRDCVYKMDIKPEQSPGDRNVYDLFELPNGLQVMLIQDKNAAGDIDEADPIAYVSMTVNVGSFNDPINRQGMAHFVEHMVFMGSKKYPDSDAYSAHISEYGGYCNAYT